MLVAENKQTKKTPPSADTVQNPSSVQPLEAYMSITSKIRLHFSVTPKIIFTFHGRECQAQPVPQDRR